MARDIEEFLRKAAERRQQQKAGGQQPPPKQPPRQQPPRQQQPRPQEPLIIDDVEIVKRRPPKPTQRQIPKKQSNIRNESVADHVKSHIDTSSIGRHADRLGDRIASVHDQVDQRIHRRLDRDLTEIDDRPTITDDPSPEIFGKRKSLVAGDIRKLLQDPKSVGQAILVAEILKRRDF